MVKRDRRKDEIIILWIFVGLLGMGGAIYAAKTFFSFIVERTGSTTSVTAGRSGGGGEGESSKGEGNESSDTSGPEGSDDVQSGEGSTDSSEEEGSDNQEENEKEITSLRPTVIPDSAEYRKELLKKYNEFLEKKKDEKSAPLPTPSPTARV